MLDTKYNLNKNYRTKQTKTTSNFFIKLSHFLSDYFFLIFFSYCYDYYLHTHTQRKYGYSMYGMFFYNFIRYG